MADLMHLSQIPDGRVWERAAARQHLSVHKSEVPDEVKHPGGPGSWLRLISQ